MPISIKPSAIPASGYVYQTLVGIRMLCDWLDNPSLFEWVQFEADTEEAARGLDDIIYQRADGLKGLIQVKFTVKPFDPANTLSWKWLTARTGTRGTSLLQKWSAAAFRVGLENTAELQLITNRRPDAEFSSQLRDGKVDLSELSEQLRSEVQEQIGGEQQAQRFFERFEFRHSYADYDNLERGVSDSLESRHTDHAGWLELWRRALEWSIHKNAPAPNGRITLEVLRSTISERQPRPLDQEFRIPAGYLPPDHEFSERFVQEAEAGIWDLRVLWGSPGQGKSTFVSYLCEKLRQRGLPFVRHHYFLDLQDVSDRFSLKSVVHSLITQMRGELDDGWGPMNAGAEDLREWVTASAEAHAKKGKRFFVLIDGLDHVWRENDREIAPMAGLFKQLLPLPPNTTLILGTQRVDEGQLPARLNCYLQPEHWVELPRMRLSAVQAWLAAQHQADTFRVASDAPLEQELAELTAVFERVSGGHPLVLTYTFLALSRSFNVLTPSVVENSASASWGDARAYYQSLWQRLSRSAKDALHLMAEDDLIWPADSLEQCLKASDFHMEAEVGHLLASVDAGLVAFHGSLYVFINSQPDHAARLQALAPKVEVWLDKEAPAYLRWAWLWLYQARRGEGDALLAGTTRAWALEALVRAYPARQIVRILDTAEDMAFERGDYEQALRKRALKTRLQNGITYQLDDADILEKSAFQLTQDPYPVLLLASEVNQSSVAGLHQLAMLFLSLGQIERAHELQQRMRDKINDRIGGGALSVRKYHDYVEQYLEVAAGTGRYEPERVVHLLRRHPRAEQLFVSFLNRASLAVDPMPLMAFSAVPMPLRLRRALEIEAVRTAAWCGAKLHEWPEFRYLRKHPLSVCWRLLYQQGDAARVHVPEVSPPKSLGEQFGRDDHGEVAQYLHFTFFATVARTLQLRGAMDPYAASQLATRKWLTSAQQRLAAVAHTCGAILARGDSPAFSLVYSALSLERPAPNDHESWSDLRAVREALVLIAADMFLLSRPRSGLTHVSSSEWARCRQSHLFAVEHFRELYLMRHYTLLDGALVRSHIEAQEADIHASICPFNEKASELTNLCEWATAYSLPDLAERLLAAAYRCAMGYGWRKDWRLPRVLEAVEEVSRCDRRVGIWAIELLAAIYSSIDDMTEKSGASPSDLAGPLIELMPQVFPGFYRDLLDRGQWYEADKAFAVFAKQVDLHCTEAPAALGFLWESAARHAITERRSAAPQEVDALVQPWASGAPASMSDSDQAESSSNDSPSDEPAMPLVEDYPPEQLEAFLTAVAGQKYEFRGSWVTRWFAYWQAQGQAGTLLSALAKALEHDRLRQHVTHLLDRAYNLSMRLQGPRKAFGWLVQAHRHRYGWSEHYHGDSESEQRIAMVARNHPKQWEDFLSQTSLPIANSYERGRAIPDAALVSLLLQVGEIERAVSVLRTMVELIVEEFEMQPLTRPSWLGAES